MKRVLFLGQADILDESSGVTKKILEQIRAFQILDCDIKGLVYKGNVIGLYSPRDESFERLCEAKGVTRRYKYWRTTEDVIKKGKTVDLVYMRYPWADPQIIKVARRIHSESKLVVEVPTVEMKADMFYGMEKIQYYVDLACRNNFTKHIDKLLFIGEQERKVLGILGTPMPNGLPYKYEVMPLTGYKIYKDEIRLLGVSNIQKNRGYDRIIRGMSEYYQHGGSYRIELVLIGGGEYAKELRNMAEQLMVAENVHFKGKMGGEILDHEFESATLGIGVLGYHRSGGEVTSALKIKEYLNRGLPFIYAGTEVGIPGDYKYALRVKNDDSAIDMDAVISFVEGFRKKEQKQVSKQIREFAIERFCWNNILKSVCGEYI